MSILGMRARVTRLLPDTCMIQRRTPASDGGGGYTETWTDLAGPVRCRIEPAAGGEAGTTADRVDDETSHVAYLPALTDITEADRVTIAGQSYDVTAVRTWGASEVYRAVELTETP